MAFGPMAATYRVLSVMGSLQAMHALLSIRSRIPMGVGGQGTGGRRVRELEVVHRWVCFARSTRHGRSALTPGC